MSIICQRWIVIFIPILAHSFSLHNLSPLVLAGISCVLMSFSKHEAYFATYIKIPSQMCNLFFSFLHLLILILKKPYFKIYLLSVLWQNISEFISNVHYQWKQYTSVLMVKGASLSIMCRKLFHN